MSELASWRNPDAGMESAVLREDGRLLILHRQQTLPILEANHVAQTLYDPVNERRSDMRLRYVARIPWVAVLVLNRMGIMRGVTVIDQKAFYKIVTDSNEFRRFRTDNGRRLGNLSTRGHYT